MAFLQLTVALVLVSIIKAEAGLHQSVTGKCEDLPSLLEGEIREVPAGLWYIPYATFGEKCGRVYVLTRQAPMHPIYGDISVIPTKDGNEYVSFTNDGKYIPDKKHYEPKLGGKAYLLGCEENDYGYYIECKEDGDKTTVGIFFGSRTPKLSEKAKKAYKDISAKLEGKNLFPKDNMHELPLTDCPEPPQTFKPLF